MQFLIADTFTDGLARLTGDQQRAVKTTAFDLQLDPARPGHQLHKLERAKDKGFWSVRVSRDLRLIVHRSAGWFVLCYVDHHDAAYAWAERRRLEAHPTTGAAQLVEIRETVREVLVPVYVEARTAEWSTPGPLAGSSDAELLGYGVPQEWLEEVRQATDDSLLAISDHLPAEAAEALLELATGGNPRPPRSTPTADPFNHPDAQRRFREMHDVEELARALDAPWEKWAVFLHPEQRQWIERSYSGPARVAGSAGTGKTVVAVHRAVHLARSHPDDRILLATFSDALAYALDVKVKRLIGNDPRLRERIETHSLRGLGLRLHRTQLGPAKLADRETVRQLIDEAAAKVADHRYRSHFLLAEWEQVVDAWQIETWEAYRDVKRLGRRARLPEAQRRELWAIFEQVRAALNRHGLSTEDAIFTRLARALSANSIRPYEFCVVDESQDLSIAQLRFFAALGADRPDALFFAGDLGQRIFQTPFSWRSVGVDIRGRSRTLRVNYRTSHQIRQQADRLMASEVVDMDGNREDRTDSVSVFNGPPPELRTFATEDEESRAVGTWIANLLLAGVAPHTIGVFVRSSDQLPRAQAAAIHAGQPARVLDEKGESTIAQITLATMHLAKGLEYSAVAVMACDDEVIPLQARIEGIGDEGDLQDTYDTERHLLYVACTRARDYLLVTSTTPASEFLDDLRG
jgi:superfamily I DNA/RNA helicase/mRNA-degrading endonuclease RelE of RelBE toxin-antitoxin system